MSQDIYEVISLAARYLFALLGILIVLRAFFWLLSDRHQKHVRLRQLPDAGMIGEFVVLAADGNELSCGTAVPVPREGILGSVRSSDVVLPAPGVNRSHLTFSFVPGIGLLITPLRGCEVLADGTPLNRRSDEKHHPLVHGSYLQVGSVLLRLRLFSGLDPSAGFDSQGTSPVPGRTPGSIPFSGSLPDPVMPRDPAGTFVPVCPVSASPEKWLPDPSGITGQNDVGTDFGMTVPSPGNDNSFPLAASVPVQLTDSVSSGSADEQAPARKRRADRWEADWSE